MVAFDDTGHAIATWTETDGLTGSSARVWINRLTWANRDSVNGEWANADTIDDELVRNRSKARVQMDASGNAIVTWHQAESTGAAVWANRFDIEDGWGDAAEVDADATWLYSMALAGNRQGQTVALTATNEQLRATRFVPGEGWDEEPTPVGEAGEVLGPALPWTTRATSSPLGRQAESSGVLASFQAKAGATKKSSTRTARTGTLR